MRQAQQAEIREQQDRFENQRGEQERTDFKGVWTIDHLQRGAHLQQLQNQQNEQADANAMQCDAQDAHRVLP